LKINQKEKTEREREGFFKKGAVKMRYVLRNRMTGIVIESFNTIIQTFQELKDQENFDKKENVFEPGFYEIFDSEKCETIDTHFYIESDAIEAEEFKKWVNDNTIFSAAITNQGVDRSELSNELWEKYCKGGEL